MSIWVLIAVVVFVVISDVWIYWMGYHDGRAREITDECNRWLKQLDENGGAE